jgi:hypothetical protein
VKLATRLDGSIHMQDRFIFLRRALVVFSALFAALPLLASGAVRLEPTLGKLLGALACALLAAALEDSDFEFDAMQREVRWSKRRLFSRRAGTIPFSDVQDVALDVRSSRSDSGLSVSRSARLFVVTRTGPFALGNSNLDIDKAREIAALLRILVGLPFAEVRRLSDAFKIAGET